MIFWPLPASGASALERSGLSAANTVATRAAAALEATLAWERAAKALAETPETAARAERGAAAVFFAAILEVTLAVTPVGEGGFGGGVRRGRR